MDPVVKQPAFQIVGLCVRIKEYQLDHKGRKEEVLEATFKGTSTEHPLTLATIVFKPLPWAAVYKYEGEYYLPVTVIARENGCSQLILPISDSEAITELWDELFGTYPLAFLSGRWWVSDSSLCTAIDFSTDKPLPACPAGRKEAVPPPAGSDNVRYVCTHVLKEIFSCDSAANDSENCSNEQHESGEGFTVQDESVSFSAGTMDALLDTLAVYFEIDIPKVAGARDIEAHVYERHTWLEYNQLEDGFGLPLNEEEYADWENGDMSAWHAYYSFRVEVQHVMPLPLDVLTKAGVAIGQDVTEQA